MDIVRTLGVAIDPNAAKSGGAEASSAFRGVGSAARDMERATTGAQKQVDVTGKSMGNTKRAGDLLRDTLNQQTTVLSKLDSAVRSLTSLLARNKTALDSVATATNSATKAAREAAAETGKMATASTQSARAAQQAASDTNAQVSSLQRLALMASAATSQLRLLAAMSVAAAASTAMATVNPVGLAAAAGGSGGGGRPIINVTGTAGSPSPQLLLQTSAAAKTTAASLDLMYSRGRVAAGMWNLMSAGATRARAAMSGIGDLAGRTANQFGVIGGVAGAALFTRGMLDSAQTQDRVTRMLRMSSGGDAGAEREMSFVKDMTMRLGLEMETTSIAYAKFVNTARLSKLGFVDIRDTFEGVANATAVMGLSAEESNGAITALTQMMSKGKVTAEELNQQLAERIPGAVALMAQAVGVGTSELMKMMERGELLAKDVLPQFGRELKKQFGYDAVRNASSTTGAINELRNAWTEFKLELIDAGLVDALKKVMSWIVTLTREFGNFVRNIRNAFGEIKTSLNDLWDGLGDSAIGKAIAGFGALSLGIADTAAGIGKNGIGKPKAVGSFALPEEELYQTMPRYVTRPSLISDFRSGLERPSKDLTEMRTFERYDSLTGQVERRMGQLERAGEDTTNAMASNFTDFWSGLVTEGGSAITRLRNMFSSLAKEIATIFARRAIAEPIAGALSMALSSFMGTPATAAAGASTMTGIIGASGTNYGLQTQSVPVHHAGGSVGGFSMQRVMPMGMFAGAPRFHSGLAPDEFPAILQRGEEVVPKNRAGSTGGGMTLNITVNVDGRNAGTPESNQAFGAEIARQIDAKIDQRILMATMARGVLSR